MPNYQYMYLVPRITYDRLLRQEESLRDKCGGKGDSLTGNVQDSAQVNHIEMAEGSRLTIKPSRAITADNEAADDSGDSRKGRRRNPAGAADRAAAEREAELADEDETDVPYVVGDEMDFDPVNNEESDKRSRATDMSTQVSLPPVISGVTSGTQTDADAAASTAPTKTQQTQTEGGPASRPKRSNVAVGTDPSPAIKRASVAVGTEPSPARSSSSVQTDPMAKFNLKDMTDLRRTAIKNWSTVRQAQRRETGENIQSVPYAQLRDDVSMEQKLDMMRRIINNQIETIVGDKSDAPKAPPISSVTISPSSSDGTGSDSTTTRLEDIVQEKSNDPLKKKKIPTLSRGKARSKIHDATKRVVDRITKQSRETEQGYSQSAQRVIDSAADEGLNRRLWRDKVMATADDTATDLKMDQRRQRGTMDAAIEDTAEDAEMERLLMGDEEMPFAKKPTKKPPSSAPKRITRSQSRSERAKAKAEEEEDEEAVMKGIINERLATLKGKPRKGKRSANQMGFPEEIERRSGRSVQKKSRAKK